MKKILQQIPNRSFTKKKFWTKTIAMLLFFMVLGALKAQAQTQTFCPGATVSNLASTPPAGATASWFTAAAGGTALATNVALTTRTYYVEISAPVTVTTIATGFNNPTGIAVQPDGKIVFADTNNDAIKRMNADGTGIVTLGTGFLRPRGIAVQADGKIVVADTNNNLIKRMDADGTNIVILGTGFFRPWGVAIEFDGKIVVADTGNTAIKRINADGTTTTLRNFITANAIAVQIDDKIVVADASTASIRRMNLDGSNIVNVGSGFFGPNSVSVQADGKIFVADTGNNTIIRMNGDGSGITTLSTDFNFPYGVAVQSAGVIVVTDSNNNSIKRISALVSINRVPINVVVSSPVTSNFALIPAFCAGTTAPALATISPNGVAGTWSPATISNIASASYVFTPTGACNTGQTLAVTVNPVATSNFSTIPAFCAGTTAPILATTSLNGVAGTWSPATISNTASGNYVFTPTATCNVGQTLSVIVNPVATSNFAAIPAFCAGTTAPTLATTSPNGVAGTWSPATINNTASGSYVFTATLSCNIGQTLSVTVIPKPNPPTATATQTFYSAVASDLVASGSNLKYYNTGGLMANNAILATGNYFISQTLNSCESATTTVAVITNSTTWTGSGWSNGLPDASRGAIIAGNYVASTNLSALQLDVTGTAVMTIPTGLNLRVINAIIVSASATLIVENNSNLIQINAATNTGTVIVKRNTFMKRLDYTYWASPVASQNLFAFTPLTVTNRFLTLSESENTFVQVVSPSSTVFALAKGYSLRAPNNFLDAPALPQNFTGQFTGVPNNGDIAIPVTFTAAPTGANGYNLIGNPYPSTVIAAQFLATNTGSLYFWTHQSSYIEGALLNGGFANYATLNLSGGVAATVLGGVNVIPNGFLQVGQGFMFKTNASKTVTFTNSMREANNGNQFFRTAASENNKLWLNLTNSNGAFSQAMIAYLPNTTTGFDDGYDAPQLNNTGLSTMIANEKYAIQSRGNFVNSDVVKLNLNTTTAGNYSFSKDNVEGIFSNSQDIFLKDNLTGTTHNIKETPYNFVATPGETANRFEIVYQSALSNNTNVFDNGNVIVFEQYGLLNLSATDDLKSVKVFDIQGRNIFELKDINAKTAVFSGFRPQQQVLLLQITNLDNKVVSKKVIF